MKLYEINSTKNFKFSCIYVWINMINNKKYVGQTKNFYGRMQTYKQGYFNPYMKHAIEKYGIENFEIEILEKDVPVDKLNEREQYWIDYYDVCDPSKGYNICPIAGTPKNVYSKRPNEHPWCGRKHTDEEKRKISEGIKKFYETHDYPTKGTSNPKQSEALKAYYSIHEVWNKGIPQTEEAKRKNSIANSGERNAFYGKHHTEETKALLREKFKGRIVTEEQRAKMSEAHKGQRNTWLHKPCICVETGKEYESLSDAAKEIGVTAGAISHACSKYPKSTAKNLHFKYKD